jgi:hypothetical protein
MCVAPVAGAVLAKAWNVRHDEHALAVIFGVVGVAAFLLALDCWREAQQRRRRESETEPLVEVERFSAAGSAPQAGHVSRNEKMA